MANKLDAFEKDIRNAVKAYEPPFNADTAWHQMESKMPPSKNINKWWYGALVAFILVPLGFWYFTSNNDAVKHSSLPQEVIIVEEVKVDAEKLTVQQSINEKVSVANSSSEDMVTDNIQPSVENQVYSIDSEETTALNQEAIPTEEGNSSSPSTELNNSIEIDGISDDTDKVPSATQLVIQLSKAKICLSGTCLATYNTTELKGQTVVWNLPNGDTKIGDSVILQFNEPGVHTITAKLQKNNNVVSNPVDIEVTPKPNAQFTMNYDLEEGGVPVVNFEAHSDTHKLYKWAFGDGTQTNGKKTQHVYAKNKDYSVELLVVDHNGCVWTSRKRAEITERFNLFAPNSFTPNADGLNDYWLPKALESNYFKFHLQLFDRAGNLVFETSTPEKQWDGRVKGNIAQQGDSFGWKCKTTDPKGIVQYYSGNITIMH